MTSFEETVKKLEEEWNENGGTISCEFSTSGVDALNKMLILDASSNRLNGGFWGFMECETCRGHDPEKPYHVDIRRCLGWEEYQKLKLEMFHSMKACERLQVRINVPTPVSTLLDVLSLLEKLTQSQDEGISGLDEVKVLRAEDLDVYKEITLLYDEHINNKRLMGDCNG